MSSQVQRGWETVPVLAPELTDELVFIRGIINNRCTIQKIADIIDLTASTATNLVYFSTQHGLDDVEKNNGTQSLPWATYEFARLQCKTNVPSASNPFIIRGDGSDVILTDFTISPFVSFDNNGGLLSLENCLTDPDWLTAPGEFLFYNSKLSMPNLGFPTFLIDLQTGATDNHAHNISFDKITILDNFNFNIFLTDATIFLYNNVYDRTSSPSGTTNTVTVDDGNFYINGSRAFNYYYTKINPTAPTKTGVINSIIQSIKLDNLAADVELAAFFSTVFDYDLDNTGNHILWIYDSISYRIPSNLIGSPPAHFSTTQPESIDTYVPRVNYTPLAPNLEGEFAGIDAALGLDAAVQTNLVYFSNAGGDDAAHDGTSARPYQTLEYAHDQCKLLTPSEANMFTVVGDGNSYTVTNLVISPFINYDLMGGILTVETASADPDWALAPGRFSFKGQLMMPVIPLVIPVFDLDLSSVTDYAHTLLFDIKLLNDFNFNFVLTDSTFFLFNNVYSQKSTNVIYVNNGNFFIRNAGALRVNYVNSAGILPTQLGLLNSTVLDLQVGEINTASTLQLVTFGSFILNFQYQNVNDKISWVYDSISYRTPIAIAGVAPALIPLTLPESIGTTVARTNYTRTAANLEGEFEGIDAALGSAGASVVTNLVYFATTGGDDADHGGTSSKPFQTYEYSLAQCLAKTPSATNQFKIIGDGNAYTIDNLIFAPWVSFDANDGDITWTTTDADPSWLTQIGNLFLSNINLIYSGSDSEIETLVSFGFDIKTGAAADFNHYIKFDNVSIGSAFDINFRLTDSSTFIFVNSYDKASLPIGTTNQIYIDCGSVYVNNFNNVNLHYSASDTAINTNFSVINSTINSINIFNITNNVIFITLNSFVLDYQIDNSSGNLEWLYDSVSFRIPTMTGGSFPSPHLAVTQPQSIETSTSRTNYTPVPNLITGAIDLESEFEGIDAALTGGGSGDVVGPASAVDGNIATYDGTTGKIIQDSGVTVIDTAPGSSGGQILVFTNANKDLILQGDGAAALTSLNGNLTLDSISNIQLFADNSGTIQVSTDLPTVTIESISESLNIHGDNGLVLTSGPTATVVIDSPNDIQIAPDTGIVKFYTTGLDVKLSAPASNLKVAAANDLLLEYGGDLYLNGVPFVGGGDVVGPASAVSGNLATYNGTTGKLVQDSGISIAPLKTAHVTNWTGIWATDQGGVGSLYYTKIADQVFLDLPALVMANANTSALISISTPLPVGLRPPLTMFFAIPIRDNGTRSLSIVEIVPTGVINVYGNTNFGNFSGLSALGQSGFLGTTLRYFI